MPLEITVYDDAGNVTSHFVGPTDEQRYEAHKNEVCDWTCGYCYEEGTSDDGHEMLDGFCTRCGLNPENASIRNCTQAEREIWADIKYLVTGEQQ